MAYKLTVKPWLDKKVETTIADEFGIRSLVAEYSDDQTACIGACRAFYTDDAPLTEVDPSYLLYSGERTEIPVTPQNEKELCTFLRNGRTWLAFKPALIEDERGLTLVL